MSVLPLEDRIVYGPIRSRRLGLSLGINILPLRAKVCSFDCVYCHYGRTQIKTLTPDPDDFPGVEIVLAAVERAIRAFPQVDSLTFSGNGEPTLHPYFPEIAFGVRRLRDRFSPQAQLSLFSNSTLVQNPRVRAALRHIDAPIMKLDAGDPDTFTAINRPVAAVNLDAIVDGLQDIPRITIQSLLLDGTVSNIRGAAFACWIEALSRLHPVEVQIYSSDYPVAEAGVQRVPAYRLKAITQEIREQTGLAVHAYWI